MLVTITICLAFGIGFGFCVQRAGLCFAHGLGEIFVGRAKRIIRMLTSSYLNNRQLVVVRLPLVAFL